MESRSRRPLSTGTRHSGRIVMRSMLRAGHRMRGAGPRRRIVKHSCSTGDWNPLTTAISERRSACAKSCAPMIRLPGHSTEQNSATFRLARISTFPMHATSGAGLPPGSTRREPGYLGSSGSSRAAVRSHPPGSSRDGVFHRHGIPHAFGGKTRLKNLFAARLWHTLLRALQKGVQPFARNREDRGCCAMRPSAAMPR